MQRYNETLTNMDFKKVFVTLTIALISLHRLPADEVRFFDNTRISSHLVTSLCQDKDGYVWIGTEYGLNRFDGMVFTHYYSYNSTLQDNYVNDLFVDDSGDMMVISGKRLQIYDRKTGLFNSVSFPEGHVPVLSDITQMTDGTIVVSNSKHGLWTIDKSSMTASPLYEINDVVGDAEIHSVLADSRDRLWMCTNNDGVFVFSSAMGVRQFLPDDRTKGITGVVESNDGSIYVLGMETLFSFAEDSWRLEELFSFHYSHSVRRLYHAADDTMYIGSYGRGLYKVDLSGKRLLTANSDAQRQFGLSNSSMTAFLEDEEGNRWFGFGTRGLLFASNQSQPFTHLSLGDLTSFKDNFLTSLNVLEDGFILVGQFRTGLHLLDNDCRLVRSYLDGRTPLAAKIGPDGSLWVGDYTYGAGVLDMRTGHMNWVLKDKRVTDFAFDSKGNVYMAVFNGKLTSFTPDGRAERTLGQTKDGLRLHGRYLNTLLSDSRGMIWVGHHYGFDVYDPETDAVVSVKCDPNLRKSIVYDIIESSDGMIWMATSRGLFGYDRQADSWVHKNASNGLMGDLVCSVSEAGDSGLWMGTYRGLVHYNRREESFSYYLKGNGLQEVSYLRGHSCAAPDGRLYFGNDLGFTSFRSEEVTSDALAKPLRAVSLIRDGKSVEVDDRIVLAHDESAFELRFSAMDYRNPENLSFEYRFMPSDDEDWRRTSAGFSEVSFHDMDYGEHVLQVRTVFNEARSAVKEVTIFVRPPWYMSGVAYTIYIILLLIFAYVLWSFWKNRELALMNEEKIRFFIDVSHEIRSPLTLIKSPLDSLMKDQHDEKTMRALGSISRNTDRLLSLVDQILSIRKLEKGAMKLAYVKTEIRSVIQSICNDYEYLAEKRNIELILDAEEDVTAWVDRKSLRKMVGNMVSNAFKYVPNGGRVEISLSRSVERFARGQMMEVMRLSVTDNGEGIDEKEIKHIFDRFYQVGSGAPRSSLGYGIGLNLTSQLVRLHGGTISARNRNDGTGAEFIMTIPLGKSHLPADSVYEEEAPSAMMPSEEPPVKENNPAVRRNVRRKTTDRVVVVDDDSEIRDFLISQLGDIYHVTAYPDGQQALQAISENPPHLVISDISMPGIDGFTLLHRIKNNTSTSHVPVILLTTRVEHEARVEGFSEGADAYMDKPFNIDELIAMTSSLIANRTRVKGKMSGMQEQAGVVKQVEMKGNDQQLMERVMKVVNERLCDADFNVEALADEVGLSRVQLHRRIKEITGITVGEFIRNLRLKQAAELLAKGDVTVSQVTYALGMSNPTHFTAAFKRYFGVTPTEYMKKHSGATNS